MVQKIIRVGNSLAVVLPKQFVEKASLHAGEEVVIETNLDMRAAYVRPKTHANQPGLTPEFKQWLDQVVKEEEDIIKALAKA